MKREFRLYPKYKENFIRAFDKMVKAREERGRKDPNNTWSDGESVFYWWINLDGNQLTFDGFDLLDV